MVIDWPALSAPDSEERLQSDKLELKAQIRTALAELAGRHGIAQGEVDHVMWAYIDQAVSDLTLAHERRLKPCLRDNRKAAPVVPFKRPPLNS